MLALVFTSAYSQVHLPTQSTSPNSNVGINQPSPQARLHITDDPNQANCKPAILIDANTGDEAPGDGSGGIGLESVPDPTYCTTPYAFRIIENSTSGNELAFNIASNGQTRIGKGINDINNLSATLNVLNSIGVYGASNYFVKLSAINGDNMIINWDSPQDDKNLDFVSGVLGSPSTTKTFSLSPAGQAAVGDIGINPNYSLIVENGMIVNEGRVGIGTQTPETTLHIKDLRPGSEINNENNPIDGVYGLLIENQGWRNHDFALEIRTGQVNEHNGRVFTVSNGGTVHIGEGLNWTIPYNPDGSFRLWVQDGIRTERVRVDIASENDWADYVFEEDYVLMTTEELEAFIKKHKHLPGVPSAEEVVEEGIDLAEMNKILLEKVEELTLRVIELEKNR